MGAIEGLVGLGGGAGGTGFSGPQTAGIQNPVTQGQVDTAYTGSQNSMASQQALLSALQAQNGIGNQSQVYNQLQGVANGTGPNPAQAQLAQATGQNVANQAALMAGQRGANANVGLMARQAAQTGAATQQNAVGQAATLQANQSLNAINSAGTMANTQASNQIGQTNANTAAQQAQLQALINAQTGYNNTQTSMQSNINNANASLANTTMQGTQNMIGGLMNSSGGASSMMGGSSGGGGAGMAGMAAMAAGGGEIEQMADGGDMPQPQVTPMAPVGPQSSFGQFLAGQSAPPAPAPEMMSPYAPPNQTAAAFKQQPGKQPPQGQQSNPDLAATSGSNLGATDLVQPSNGTMMAAKGGVAKDFRGGGPVQAANVAEKAAKSGNSYANDKIPAVLSEHEIVIPRSITLGKDPVNQSAQFVQAVLAKRRVRR